MASEQIFNVDSQSFEDQVLGAESPVLVDFWATWWRRFSTNWRMSTAAG